jgi:hypothetical protein
LRSSAHRLEREPLVSLDVDLDEIEPAIRSEEAIASSGGIFTRTRLRSTFFAACC